MEEVHALRSAGTTSVEELVEVLVAAEESNFSLFNYVNELNGEIEKLEDQIAGVRWVCWVGLGRGLLSTCMQSVVGLRLHCRALQVRGTCCSESGQADTT
jgi:hypothetical protein